MTFPLLGKSYFFACAAIAAQSREARCKNSRSAERGCSSVHPPPNRRRMGGDSNLAPPPTGYRRAIARSAVQKTAGAQSAAPAGAFRSATAAGGTWRGDRMFLCSPAAEEAANGWRRQPCPTTNRLSPRNRAKRGAKTAGAQSAAPAGAFRSATAAGGTWRGDRMFLCSPAAEQATNGWRRQPGPTAGGSSKPRATANKLSPRRAKLALNVRIGCSCRAHNHHKFSHRILQPHTKRRASHAD